MLSPFDRVFRSTGTFALAQVLSASCRQSSRLSVRLENHRHYSWEHTVAHFFCMLLVSHDVFSLVGASHAAINDWICAWQGLSARLIHAKKLKRHSICCSCLHRWLRLCAFQKSPWCSYNCNILTVLSFTCWWSIHYLGNNHSVSWQCWLGLIEPVNTALGTFTWSLYVCVSMYCIRLTYINSWSNSLRRF